MTSAPLTRRQHQILDFFRGYVAEHGISPTLEEVANSFGVNKVTIFGHVSELERKGLLSRAAKGVSRGLQLVEEPAAKSAAVPILGRIAAGRPIDVVAEPETFELGDLVPEDRDVYALRVQGQSMIDDGIRDGDIVLVENRHTAHNGEMVVAVLPNEETTLKRFYREPDRVRLQPANPDVQPIYATDVEIRGVVIGVVRRF